jgi:hypothetical protein
MCDRGRKIWPDGRYAGDTALRIHEIGQAVANGNLRAIQLPADHNRIEVLVGVNAAAVAGDVAVARSEAVEAVRELRALAGTVAFNAAGGRLVLEVAPGAQLGFAVANIGGAGAVISVAAVTWAEW